MRKCMFLFVTVVTAISVSSCATFIYGSRQNIVFRSSPDNATVEVYNSYGQHVATATTPATIRFERSGSGGYFRRANFVVQISKDGYDTQTINIRGDLNRWYIGGNFLYVTWLGWLIIDPMTGAMWTLKPQSVDVNLQQIFSFDNSDGEDGIFVVLKEQIPEDIFAELDLIPIQ